MNLDLSLTLLWMMVLFMWTVMWMGFTYAFVILNASRRAERMRRREPQVMAVDPSVMQELFANPQAASKPAEKKGVQAAEFPPQAGLYL